MNSFIRFLGKEELEIKKITVDLLEQYRDYIINVRNERVKALQAEGKRVPSNRCLSLYLMSLRHLYGEAQRFYNKPDKGLMRIPHTPFEYFKIPKQEATRKRAFTSSSNATLAYVDSTVWLFNSFTISRYFPELLKIAV